MNEFYNLINNKDKSMYHFVKFLDFMIDNNKYVNSERFKPIKDDFNYHFDKIPNYTREILEKLRHDLIGDVASIQVCNDRLSERINEFTKQSK